MLDIESAPAYSDILTGREFHTYPPYNTASFRNSDEVRIPLNYQDVITAPFESYLYITGKVEGKKADNTPAKVHLVNNAMAFLFEEIRYEIGGVEVDRTRNLGITTTMKSLCSVRPDEKNMLENACWFGAGQTKETTEFCFLVPLKLLLGFAEDYRRIVTNVKQELILLRSASDLNAIKSDDATSCTLTIASIDWHVPHYTVSDPYRFKLLKMVEKNATVSVPFRSWELHELPILPKTKVHSWLIKTSIQLEKPRYVIVGLQKNRKNDIKQDMSCFDDCKLNNVRLYLNSRYYPYDNVLGNVSIFYEMFARFQSSYYGKDDCPTVDLSTFKSTTPLYVIDCSKQNDTIKSGPVDIKVHLEAKDSFPDNTAAYCLILHDSQVLYSLLTGNVQKVTM